MATTIRYYINSLRPSAHLVKAWPRPVPSWRVLFVELAQRWNLRTSRRVRALPSFLLLLLYPFGPNNVQQEANERTPQQGAIKPETTGGGVVAGWLVEKVPTHCRHFCPHFFFFLQTKPSHIYNAVAHESLSCPPAPSLANQTEWLIYLKAHLNMDV